MRLPYIFRLKYRRKLGEIEGMVGRYGQIQFNFYIALTVFLHSAGKMGTLKITAQS